MINLISNGYASFETAKKVKAKGYNNPTKMILRRINFHCESMNPEARKDPANWSEWEGIESYDPFCDSYEEKLDNGAIKEQVVVPLAELHIIQKWFRDEHKLHPILIPKFGGYTYNIIDAQCDVQNKIKCPPYECVCVEDFSSYEEALNDALQEMCNLI